MANIVEHVQFDYSPGDGPEGWVGVGVVVDRSKRDWAMTATVPVEMATDWMVEATRVAVQKMPHFPPEPSEETQ